MDTQAETMSKVAQELRAAEKAETSPKKRGRPRRKPEVSRETENLAEATVAVNQAFALVAAMPYDILARKNPIWTLTATERANLGQAVRVLVDRYISDWLADYSEIVGLLLVNATIIIPRVAAQWSMINDNSDSRTAGERKNDVSSHTGANAASGNNMGHDA